MLPASNRGAGNFIAAPDVCRTPPGPGVPVPYVNNGMNAAASVFSPNVYISMMNALTLGSVIPVTQGDEPGVLHNTQMGLAMVLGGNLKILINFLPAATLTSPTSGNRSNAFGLIAIPSLTNVFMTFAPARAGAARSPGREGASPRADDRSAPIRDGLRRGRASARSRGGIREGLQELAGELDAAIVSATTTPGGAQIRMSLITGPSVARAIHLLRSAERSGAARLILDLRGCRGGDLKAGARLVDQLVPRGALIAAIDWPDGDRAELRARSRGQIRAPVDVWIDGGTASAAEMIAASLRALGRARLIGRSTYGKSSVQTLVGAPGARSCADVATFSVAGRPIPTTGLRPDVDYADTLTCPEDYLVT